MKTRRQFIIDGISGFSACSMAPAIARQITNHYANSGEPFLDHVHDPEIQIYADLCFGQYSLTLDHPRNYKPPRMDWSECCDEYGIDVYDQDGMKEWMIDHGFFDPNSGEKFVLPDPNALIPDCIHSHYMEWRYETSDSPSARAFHYLSSLDLGQHDQREEDGILASLEFVEGPCPGNNFTGVSTKNPEALSCLQQRLRQLDVDANITVTRLFDQDER